MDEDWGDNSGEAASSIPVTAKKKWEDEDTEKDNIKESWELSSSEDDEDKSTTEAAPKKMSIAQKLAERQAAERKNNNDEGNGLDVLEKNIENAEEMAKRLSIEEEYDSPLNRINPKNKDEFDEFSSLLIERIKKHDKQAMYPSFINGFVRDLCSALKEAEIRKVANTLTILANEKKAQKEATKTKKKKPKPSVVVEVEDLKNFEDYEDDFDYFI